MSKNIVKPYYKYKQKAFADLVKAIEVIATRVWSPNNPLNFLPIDFAFEINYTLGGVKSILIGQKGDSLGKIIYEGDVFFIYYDRVGDSAKVGIKKVPLTFEEFKSIREATLNLGRLTENEPSDFLFSYVVKATENKIIRYNPFPGGGGGDSSVHWVRR